MNMIMMMMMNSNNDKLKFQFEEAICRFVEQCLLRDPKLRPEARELLDSQWIQTSERPNPSEYALVDIYKVYFYFYFLKSVRFRSATVRRSSQRALMFVRLRGWGFGFRCKVGGLGLGVRV